MDTEPAEAPVQFEIVLEPRQLASVLFVVTVILVLCSSVSYVAGKAAQPVPATPTLANREPQPETPIPAEPAFANVRRKPGFQAFSAPWPRDQTFRVTIESRPTEITHAKTKDAVAKIGP